jgi:hypothetical protein
VSARQQHASAAVPPSHHRPGATSGEDARERTPTSPGSDKSASPLFIVASPRPQSGKTFLARLVIDYLRLDGADPRVFDVNPPGDGLQDYLADVAEPTDLAEITHQMALFDHAVLNAGAPKVVDLGHASFDRFFQIVQDIDLLAETGLRAIECLVLFAADPHPISIQAYADLRRSFPSAIVVPVFNEALSRGKKLRNDFPFERAAAVPLQISALAPMLKAQMEKAHSSFIDFYETVPMGIPLALACELRSWTRRTFLEFRELELRLLLEKLRAALPSIKV